MYSLKKAQQQLALITDLMGLSWLCVRGIMEKVDLLESRAQTTVCSLAIQLLNLKCEQLLPLQHQTVLRFNTQQLMRGLDTSRQALLAVFKTLHGLQRRSYKCINKF